MDIPDGHYIALYGTNSGDWRAAIEARLTAAGIAFFDPTDKRWASINDDNGDALQPLVDQLVAREHQGMRSAVCVIFHVARRKRSDGAFTGETTNGFASRAELGFLAGQGIRTFVHVETDVLGRNYLWALCALYPETLVRVADLEEAAERATRFFHTRT
jgi:hypothetical protein